MQRLVGNGSSLKELLLMLKKAMGISRSTNHVRCSQNRVCVPSCFSLTLPQLHAHLQL